MKKTPDVGYLVIGLLFLGLAGAWLLNETGVLDSDDRWIVPLILVGAGTVGLAATVARRLGRNSAPEPAADDEPTLHLEETS